MIDICGKDAVTVVNGVHRLGWDISEPMVNERTGRLCFLVHLNDLEQEPVTFLQMTGGFSLKRCTPRPPTSRARFCLTASSMTGLMDL